MTINILAIGDVVGQTGLAFLKEHLKPLQKLKGVSFTVVNGENANVVGITPAQADAILAAGADVVTLGNHTWTRWELQPYLDEKARILRPANYAPQCPGRGDATYTTPFGPIRVINLLGRFSLDTNTDNPFPTVDALLAENQTRMVLVDMHAEATSEKLAFAHRFDGEIQIMFGTHTHVQTADEQLLDKGSGYITDLGMCGDAGGVLGVKSECVVSDFTTKVHMRFEGSEGNFAACGALFTLDTRTRCVTDVKRIRTCKNGTVMV